MKESAITRIQLTLDVIYDPVLLLFYHLARGIGRAKGEPITAREIVERSEQHFQYTAQDEQGNLWVSISGNWYPAELLTIARERL
mgnify:CR=1 FL=1